MCSVCAAEEFHVQILRILIVPTSNEIRHESNFPLNVHGKTTQFTTLIFKTAYAIGLACGPTACSANTDTLGYKVEEPSFRMHKPCESKSAKVNADAEVPAESDVQQHARLYDHD